MQGQRTFKSWNAWTNVSARRVTEKNKFLTSFWYDRSEDVYESADSRYVKTLENKSAEIEHYWGFDEHWSAGLDGGYSSNQYSNYDAQVYLLGGVERSIFPYSETTKKELYFRYSLIWAYNDYIEETVYNKFHEYIVRQRFSASLNLTQTWGSAGIYAEASNLLRDFNFNRQYIQGNISLRVFSGFTVDFNGSFARIYDQISLIKANNSQDDLLLRRHQLGTTYQYNASIGFSYTFGSVFTNIVNPRFGNW